MNKAMQLKLLWEIEKNQNSKWGDLIKAKYFRDSKFMDYEKGKNCS